MNTTLAPGVSALTRAGTCGRHAYVGVASKHCQRPAPSTASRHHLGG